MPMTNEEILAELGKLGASQAPAKRASLQKRLERARKRAGAAESANDTSAPKRTRKPKDEAKASKRKPHGISAAVRALFLDNGNEPLKMSEIIEQVAKAVEQPTTTVAVTCRSITYGPGLDDKWVRPKRGYYRLSAHGIEWAKRLAATA